MSETTTDATAPAEGEPRPFALRSGTRLRLGPRRGTVTRLRGGTTEPYDVQIRWDGHKYPEWHIYRSLLYLHRQGRLEVLEE